MKEKSTYRLLPIIFVLGVIPLIVHTYVYDSNLAQFDWYLPQSEVDLFLAWKMIFVIVAGSVMLVVLMAAAYKHKIEKFDNSLFFLIGYAFFVGLSALCSPYKYWVNRGTHDYFESVWAVFAYLIILFYTFQFINEEKEIRIVVLCSGIGMMLVALIGAFQVFGYDIYLTDFWKMLIVDSQYWGTVALEKLGSVCSTIFNPNYLPSYFGVVIPLSLASVFVFKKLWQKLFFLLLIVLSVICLWGAKSASMIALPMGFFVTFSVLMTRRKKLCMAYGVLVTVGVLLFGVVLTTTAFGEKIKIEILGQYSWGEEGFAVTEIKTEDDHVTATVYGHELRISYESMGEVASLTFRDEDGIPIPYELTEDNILILKDERFPNVSLGMTHLEDMQAVCLFVNDGQWIFSKDIDGTYYFYNPVGKFVKVKEIKRSSLFNEDAFSYRGRIWNKTLPLIPAHILVGSGANTFVFEMTQEDYIVEKEFYKCATLDVKAHNWYLQQMVETGVVGTLLLIAFLLWYVIRSIRIYRRVDLKNTLSLWGLGAFTAVVVYLFASIVNDSQTCTSPVFWTVLGMGMAINSMLVKSEGLFVKEASVQEIPTEQVSEASAMKSAPTAKKKMSRKQRKNTK